VKKGEKKEKIEKTKQTTRIHASAWVLVKSS